MPKKPPRVIDGPMPLLQFYGVDKFGTERSGTTDLETADAFVRRMYGGGWSLLTVTRFDTGEQVGRIDRKRMIRGRAWWVADLDQQTETGPKPTTRKARP